METNFGPYYQRPKKYCKKCKRNCDHTERLCNEYHEWICPICAGQHSANILCPMQICSICGKNHLDANCKVNPSKLKCSICNINGHSDEMCTNNWKLYHNVTDLKDLNHIKPPNLNSNNMICITCGSSQHWTFKCSDLKNTSSYYNPLPNSKGINRIKERINKRIKNSDNSFSIDLNIEIDNEVIDLCDVNDESIICESPITINSNGDCNNQLKFSKSNQDVQIVGELIHENPSKRIKTERTFNETGRTFKETISQSQMNNLIDKNIRSEAVKFNAITMKNVKDFIPKELNSNSKKPNNQPSTSFKNEDRPDNKIKNKLILRYALKEPFFKSRQAKRASRRALKRRLKDLERIKNRRPGIDHRESSNSNKIKSKKY